MSGVFFFFIFFFFFFFQVSDMNRKLESIR